MASVNGPPIVKRKIMTTMVGDHSKRIRTNEVGTESILSTSSHDNQQKTTSDTTMKFQNQLVCRMEEILSANGKISTVYARNYLDSHNQRSCRLQTESRNNEKVWSSIVLTHIHHMAANRHHIVMASQMGELFCYSTISGAIQMSLRFEHPILRLVLNNHYCAVHQNNNEIVVRDLKSKSNSTKYVLPLHTRNAETLSSFVLSESGLPVIFLSNGDVWFFSERVNGWQQIQTAIDSLTKLTTYLDFIQKAVPNGLISKIVLNKKQLKFSSVPTALMAESNEEEQIERLLKVLDELNYPNEYSLLASVYISRLVSRGKVRRLYSYKESLINKTNIDVMEIQNEIESQLDKYPHIRQSLQEIPEKMNEELYIEEDLGFLD